MLRQFHAFCAGAVLVAHNGSFDMEFISLKQPTAGVVFDQPVLHTLLLTMAIGGDWLDRRRGAGALDPRPGAAAGVLTLEDALDVCRRQIQLAPAEVILRESGR